MTSGFVEIAQETTTIGMVKNDYPRPRHHTRHHRRRIGRASGKENEMSEMEFFHGYFEPSDLPIEPEDTDDFYDLEQKHRAHFVKVQGTLYKFWGSGLDIEPHGFNVVAPACERPQLLLYWYNGGAGLHEVAEAAIENWLKGQDQ